MFLTLPPVGTYRLHLRDLLASLQRAWHRCQRACCWTISGPVSCSFRSAAQLLQKNYHLDFQCFSQLRISYCHSAAVWNGRSQTPTNGLGRHWHPMAVCVAHSPRKLESPEASLNDTAHCALQSRLSSLVPIFFRPWCRGYRNLSQGPSRHRIIAEE